MNYGKIVGKLLIVLGCLVAIAVVASIASVRAASADKNVKVTANELPTRMDALEAARLDAALAKVRSANAQMAQLQREADPAVKQMRDIASRFKLVLFDERGNPVDTINFETGEITRAPRQPPVPAASPPPPAVEPTKTAKK